MVRLCFLSGPLSRAAHGPHLVDALACSWYGPTQHKHEPWHVSPQQQTEYCTWLYRRCTAGRYLHSPPPHFTAYANWQGRTWRRSASNATPGLHLSRANVLLRRMLSSPHSLNLTILAELPGDANQNNPPPFDVYPSEHREHRPKHEHEKQELISDVASQISQTS